MLALGVEGHTSLRVVGCGDLVRVYADSQVGLAEAIAAFERTHCVLWDDGPLDDEDGNLYYEAIPR